MFDTRLRGAPLLAEAVRTIEARPETWNQSDWITGGENVTAYCIGTWCLKLAGAPLAAMFDGPVYTRLGKLLGISERTAIWLCQSDRTFEEIEHFSETLILGFNAEGRDRDGFDWEGYHRDNSRPRTWIWVQRPASL